MARSVFALVLSLAAVAKAERLPMQSDFGRCANAVQSSGHEADLQGQLRMEILVRRDGRVFAAFVAGERGIGNRRLERCLANEALLWQLPPVPIDYQRTYAPITFVPGGSESRGDTNRMGVGSGQTSASVMMPDINNPPSWEPIDPVVSQETLDVTETATLAERGLASLAVRDYPAAVRALRDALQRSAEDAVALRGLVQALLESDGDPAEARQLAERLVKLDPSSVGGHEAMIRVCIAQKDPACLATHWKAAKASKDFLPRQRLFAEQLQAKVMQAVADARRAPAAEGQAQADQKDECAAQKGDDATALCLVRRCLDAGSAQYAKELSEQNRTEYVVGEWRAKRAGAGRVIVSREIATKDTPPQRHEPMWLVKLGEQVTMQPTNAEARQITLTHNACAARVSSGK